MAFVNDNGFCNAVLRHIADITKSATPQLKVEPEGFLNMLMNQSSPSLVSLNSEVQGHQRGVRIKRKQRFTKDFVDKSKSCDRTNVQPFQEEFVVLESTNQIAIHLEDKILAQYCGEASKNQAIGTPRTNVSKDLLDSIASAASALLQGVSEDLQTIAVAKIGINRNTGNNAAKNINLTLNSTTAPLTDGLTEVLKDFADNGGRGTPQVYGNGLFHSFMIQEAAKGPNQAGLNTVVQSNGIKFYHDLQSASILGANEVILYEPDAIQIVQYQEYVGWQAGERPDGSTFFVLPLPMQTEFGITPVLFDAQLKYNSCPETFTNAYYNTPITLDKGWNLILSKQCGLYTIPSGAYRATDVLNGNRGSYRYSFTNA